MFENNFWEHVAIGEIIKIRIMKKHVFDIEFNGCVVEGLVKFYRIFCYIQKYLTTEATY